jgi:hypothetical protein
VQKLEEDIDVDMGELEKATNELDRIRDDFRDKY